MVLVKVTMGTEMGLIMAFFKILHIDNMVYMMVNIEMKYTGVRNISAAIMWHVVYGYHVSPSFSMIVILLS